MFLFSLSVSLFQRGLLHGFLCFHGDILASTVLLPEKKFIMTSLEFHKTESCLFTTLISGQPVDPCIYSSIADCLVMAVTASSTSNGPRFRYALEDPTLPKPWKGLVDRSTGYLYFWNTETNVTQYERPAATPLLDPIPSPELKSASSPINSSTQIHQSSGSSLQEQQKNDSSREYSRDNGGDDNVPRQAAASAVRKHPVIILLIVNCFYNYNMPSDMQVGIYLDI